MTIRSYLDITGPIDSDTPFVVLCEILESHGKITDKLTIDKLTKVHYLIRDLAPIDLETNKLKCMSLFVNPRVTTWTVGTLNRAFKFLCKPKITENFKYGRQTPDNIRSLNAGVLYRECKKHNIKLNVTSTIEEMAIKLRYTLFPATDITMYITYKLPELNKETLLSLLSLIGVSDRSSLVITKPTKVPNTDDEAIASCAYYYNVDISKSLCPMGAFQYVSQDPISFANADLRQQPEPYPNLKFHFNPNLPFEYYSTESLSSLIHEEGLIARDMKQAYNLLVDAYSKPNFRLIGNAKETMINCDDVNNFNYGEVVYLEEFAFSLNELRDYFAVKGMLINPTSKNGNLLKNYQIKKLITICKNYPSSASNCLLQKMNEIEELQRKLSDKHREFIHHINKQNDKRQDVIETFWKLHELSMYMRGWDGQSQLPIEEALVNDPIAVEEKVYNSLIEFCNKLELLEEETRDRILNLNLYCMREDGLRTTTLDDMVPTLGLRLELVKGGEELQTIESCIRISSNYFAATSHYILTSLGCNMPYDLSKLRYIS